MAYLTLGPEFYKYSKDLYNEIISTLKNPVLLDQMGDVKKIGFDSDEFHEDEFCVAFIKNKQERIKKGQRFILFEIIKSDNFNLHLNK